MRGKENNSQREKRAQRVGKRVSRRGYEKLHNLLRKR